MALLTLWRKTRDEVIGFNIEQAVAVAGGANLLRDESDTSRELREFFGLVPSESLFAYAEYCLENSFTNSGRVLQDIVNQLGERLEFEVEDGLYQGRRDSIGFDGVWRYPDEPALIVEVKTTDAYTMQLEVLANYKEALVSAGRVRRDASILIVVGRSDTDALEAQVRGSRYAWNMRLISVEGLIKLVQVKEKSDDPDTLRQIRQLLQPLEYTKLDKIIDVVFATATDVESQETAAEDEEVESIDQPYRPSGHQIRTESELIRVKRTEAVDAFARSKGSELVQRSKTLFWSPDRELRVCCAVSKRYGREYQPYWYGYHVKWDEFLGESREGYLILSCMDRNEAFALPYNWLAENKSSFNRTDRDKDAYWHIALATLEGGRLAINLSKIGRKIDLEPYRYKFGPG